MGQVARLILISCLWPCMTVVAQQPWRHFAEAIEGRAASSDPLLHYTVRLTASDTSRFAVELQIRNAPDSLRLAMMRHPEYDDRYWRQVEGLTVTSNGAAAVVSREDSAVWRVRGHRRELTVRYTIRLAERGSPRAAWRPMLTPTGGLIGGPHSYLYVIGAELAPAHVTLELPAGWQVATGLEPTSDPATWFAATINALVDAPVFVGQFHSWHFRVDGVPHRVVYWRSPTAVPFDTTTFVSVIERLAREATGLFGRAPYREYTFIYQDDSYGALEHANSVTLGARSASLAKDPTAHLEETSHEFFHAWNLMRIRPVEYRGVSHLAIEPSSGLWWSEGLTIYYADLLLRRAGLPVPEASRLDHLEGLITRYTEFPGNGMVSAERVSRAEYSNTESLGDYVASSHLQGELLGTMLDLKIREATGGTRSMDDVMRLMLEQFSGERGFTSRDIEQVIAQVCRCTMVEFFDAHVRGGTPLDFDRYLAPIGFRVAVEWRPALSSTGAPEPDLRVRPADMMPGDPIRLVMTDPTTAWGRAGLHAGDELVTINSRSMDTWPTFRSVLSSARLGDTLHVVVRRDGAPLQTDVVLTGYQRPVVRLEEVAGATAAQRALRERWLSGAP